ncbi:acyl-CoA synthetase family member 2, mitochondrial-like, partial [Diaphorina citri]|uniref:Medium-chain acyl-CoA ligase ACSF2, mitochondrial n=1 Tax=Diaphorina citri TaxID=121845 RepID=A0A1S4EMX2_DIACI
MFWESGANTKISDGSCISNKPSYWNEKSTEPLKTVTIGQLLDDAALQYGDKEALVSCHQNQRLSFKQIQAQANDFAAGLLAGVHNGEPTIDRSLVPTQEKINHYNTHVIINSEQNLKGTFRLSDIMQGAGPEYHRRREQISKSLNCRDGINIQFTSGTTGHPKAAFLTHYNLINNSNFIGKRLEFDKTDHKILLQVPMFHTFGTAMGILNAMNHGSTTVVPAPSFKPMDSLRAIAKEKCTVLYGTPTMYVDLISSIQPLTEEMPNIAEELSSPVIALTAGAPCSPTLFNKIRDTFGIKHLILYFQVKVVDKKGNIVPMGMCGEVCYRGYNVMLGYYGEENKILENDEWFPSGDFFILHENGYGQVVGRIKDIIIRGGENIIPKEIEYVLQTHPDVVEAQVYGVPDERLGEVVVANIELKPGASLTQDDIKTYCKGK